MRDGFLQHWWFICFTFWYQFRIHLIRQCYPRLIFWVLLKCQTDGRCLVDQSLLMLFMHVCETILMIYDIIQTMFYLNWSKHALCSCPQNIMPLHESQFLRVLLKRVWKLLLPQCILSSKLSNWNLILCFICLKTEYIYSCFCFI